MLLPSVMGLIQIGQMGFVETIEKEIGKVLNDTFEQARVIIQSGENGHIQENTRLLFRLLSVFLCIGESFSILLYFLSYRIPPANSVNKGSFGIWLDNLKKICLSVEQILHRVRVR